MVAGASRATVALVSSRLGGFWCGDTLRLRRQYHAGLLSRTQSAPPEKGMRLVREDHRILV